MGRGFFRYGFRVVMEKFSLFLRGAPAVVQLPDEFEPAAPEFMQADRAGALLFRTVKRVGGEPQLLVEEAACSVVAAAVEKFRKLAEAPQAAADVVGDVPVIVEVLRGLLQVRPAEMAAEDGQFRERLRDSGEVGWTHVLRTEPVSALFREPGPPADQAGVEENRHSKFGGARVTGIVGLAVPGKGGFVWFQPEETEFLEPVDLRRVLREVLRALRVLKAFRADRVTLAQQVLRVLRVFKVLRVILVQLVPQDLLVLQVRKVPQVR